MERAIWKYVLRPTDHQFVTLPMGSKPLYVAEQRGEIVLYAHVRTAESQSELRNVWIHGTGHPTRFTKDATALGVVSLEGGALMFHVFIEPAEDNTAQ